MNFKLAIAITIPKNIIVSLFIIKKTRITTRVFGL